MRPSIKRFRPTLFRQICAMQQDMLVVGGVFDRHADALAELADWTEDLLFTGSALVISPSTGGVERLASAIAKSGAAS